jgi:hypothetical protein
MCDFPLKYHYSRVLSQLLKNAPHQYIVYSGSNKYNSLNN